jgi:hypothetical protein
MMDNRTGLILLFFRRNASKNGPEFNDLPLFMPEMLRASDLLSGFRNKRVQPVVITLTGDKKWVGSKNSGC